MAVLKNRAKMSTSTTGTGTITLGSAESGYQSFADAGVANADVVRYVIEDGNNWEIGTGTYTATGTTLSRTVSESSNADAAINLSGSATVFIGATAEDIPELYADNYTSGTKPTATGTNAVAIGENSQASGAGAVAMGYESAATQSYSFAAAISGGLSYAGARASNSIAMGYRSTTNNLGSVAIGYTASTSGNYSIALGNSAITGGTDAIALGKSRAGGTDSFAAQIGSNSSLYGATGNNATAVGVLTKATGLDFVFGRSSIASGGSGSLSLGMDNTSSAGGAVTLGKGNTSSHTDAVVIGQGASSSAADEITLGHTDQTVRISSSYTLPTSDGTNGQVLTTDGAGAVTFAAAGGGADLYAANEVNVTAQPSATGVDAIAIGDSAVASGADAFAIGLDAVASGVQSMAFGRGTDATSTSALALGSYAQAVTGSYATAISRAYASGADSFAAAIATNSSSYGATGANSIAIGQTSKATDNGSVAIGKSCISNGGRTVALGHQTTASEFYSFAVGALSEALQTGSVCTGVRGRSDVQGKRVHSSSTFSAQIGNCQTGETVLGTETTDATPAQLTSIPGNAASATNSITLPNNSCYGFTGTVIARENSAQTNDFAVWEIKGGAVRAATAATTALGSYNINKISESTGAANWSIALSADTTNGAVAITVTGEALHSIRWVATVNTTEVTY